MRAVVADKPGPLSTLALREMDFPEPAEGEICIQVAAAGVSFVDALLVTGAHQTVLPSPYIPGTECAGIVHALGGGVTKFQVGDRVVAIPLPGGAFAEFVTTKASSVTKAPSNIAFDILSVFAASYATSYHALVQRGQARSGEAVLVRGAAGALGVAAIQIAVALGLRVIGSASSAEGRAVAIASGAQAAIDATSATWRHDLNTALGERQLDIVFDPVGGDGAIAAFRSLGWGGRHLVLGFADGTIPSLPVNLALLKGAALVGVDLAAFMRREPKNHGRNMAELMDLLAAGKLAPRVGVTLPIESFADALMAVNQRSARGRVILRISSVI